MLKEYREGSLNFKPLCSMELLQGQLDSMELYALHLDERSKIENIDLN
jgi:hypothetical protein